MSLIPQEFVAELLGRTDIVDVVGSAVQLKKAGTNYKGLCPFHSEKSPSFTVSPSKQFYHCFGCGAHGTAIGFLMEHLGMSFPEAVRDLAGRAGMTVPEAPRDPRQVQAAREQRDLRDRLIEALEQANAFYRARLRKDARAIAYLKGRGLDGRIAAHFGLGYAPDDWQGLAGAFPNYDADILIQAGLVVARDAQGETLEPSEAGSRPVERRWDRLRDRITFPIRNAQGQLIGFGGRVLDRGEPKYLNSPETALFHKGEELYGLHEARTAIQRQGYAVLVEGYLDVIALAQAGIGNAVATLGTACTPEHVRRLFRYCPQLVFCFDGDAAGRRAASRAMESALPSLGDDRSVKFLFLPTEHDPDTFVRAHGSNTFEREVGRAQPLSVFLLDHVASGLALGTAEGRAQAISRARPLLALLPESALKSQIAAELARQLQTTPDELRATRAATPAQQSRGDDAPDAAEPPAQRYQEGYRQEGYRQEGYRQRGGDGFQPGSRGGKGGFQRGGPRFGGAPAPARHLPKPQVDHAHTALRILLAHPSLWAGLGPAQQALLTHDETPGHAVARWLESALDADPDLSAAAVWEGLRGAGVLDQAPAPAELLDAGPEALRADLNGALLAVEMAAIKRRQQHLAQTGLPDAAARIEYQSLSSRLAELSRLLPRL